MASADDFKALQEGLQKSLVSVTKSVNRIAAEDLGFQRTINPDVADLLDERSSRLLDLSTRLLRSAANTCGLKAPKLEDNEDIDMNWRQIVDVVDTLLEKADTALDEYTGLIKRKEPPTADTAPDAKRARPTGGKVIRHANISKPQLQFERKPDNFPTTPWKPILSDKPNALVSLDKSLATFKDENGATQYKHPYETEIKAMEYPEHVFHKAEPIPYQPLEGTDAIYVDTFEGVLEMLEHLKQAKEIAIDLEHHDFRTYTGLVSLMQVSTRTQDWIVDTLKPWRHRLEVLNQVFTDPSILKVFHGASSDVIWLQRDLGLYINGLFDTYFACKLLSYQAKSLAYLLSRYVNFDADKQYQLADWRLRPLPKEMLYYARSDTHYLLYIYDCVRNDLFDHSDPKSPEGDLLREALQNSRELTLSRHEHLEFDKETGQGLRGWHNYILKHGGLAFTSEQFAVFRAVWEWRDDTARKEDESPNFVVGTGPITEIAKFNPPDRKALHSLLPPISPLARPRLDEIWDAIQQAKARGGPSLLQFITSTNPDYMGVRGASAAPKQSVTLPLVEGEVKVSKLVKSQLFGDMPISSRWENLKQAPPNQDDHVPFPWQRYVNLTSNAEASEEVPASTEVKAVVEPEPAAPAPETPEEAEDQEFTLKRGKKRKAAPTAETSESSSSEDDAGASLEEEEDEGEEPQNGEQATEDDDDNVMSVDEEADPQDIKMAKKVKNLPKRRGQSVLSQTGPQDVKGKKKRKGKKEKEKPSFNAVPFDYSQAASVMHANRNGSNNNKTPQQKGAKQQVFDPYAKAGESDIKGARKAMPVRGERSATFKK